MLSADQKIETAEPSNVVIFGAAGDLTKRKLMPSLYKMVHCGLVHPQSRIIGVVNNRTDDVWLSLIKEGLNENLPEEMTEDMWQHFSEMLTMVSGDLGDEETYQRLSDALEVFDGKKNTMF